MSNRCERPRREVFVQSIHTGTPARRSPPRRSASSVVSVTTDATGHATLPPFSRDYRARRRRARSLDCSAS
jgi:hypothetical protein